MAYYSARSPIVYHICKNCEEGTAINRANLREGQPLGVHLCPLCEKARQQGQCVEGVPAPAG